MAGSLEKRYKKKLKKKVNGRPIRTTIKFEPLKGADKDNDVDVEIRIAPNATVVPGAAVGGGGGGKYPTGHDVSSRSIDELWSDSTERTSLKHLLGGKKESKKEKAVRIGFAKAELKKKLNNDPDNYIEKILKFNHGQKPRAFRSAASEDSGPGSGHTTERHVFGMGLISNIDWLAVRVTRKRVQGTNMGNPGKAGAFYSIGGANKAIKSSLQADLGKNWKSIRNDLVKGSGNGRVGSNNEIDIREPLKSKGIQLIKNWPGAAATPSGGKVAATHMPSWMSSSYSGFTTATGTWPLHPEDSHSSNDPAKAPLTKKVIPSVNYIRVLRLPSAPNGWYVNSSWPE